MMLKFVKKIFMLQYYLCNNEELKKEFCIKNS